MYIIFFSSRINSCTSTSPAIMQVYLWSIIFDCTKKREECELSIWFKSANLVCKSKIF